MELIIGGRAQGKLDYALAKTGLTKEEVSFGELSGKPILYGLQDLVLKLMEEGRNPISICADISARQDVIVICDEMGSGLVPIDAFQREYRDTVGKVCCELAKSASTVTRVYCGIGTVIKG